MEKHDIKEFIIKYSLVSSVIVWVIGNQFKEFLFNIISLLVEPFFSIDLNIKLTDLYLNFLNKLID